MSAEEYAELEIQAGDRDGDGYADAAFAFGDDCDDTDPEVNPGAAELVYNGIDDDCDARTPDDDLDQDGALRAEDCDDTDPDRSPLLPEVWYDGVDQDCDGSDADQDGDGEDWVEMGGTDCDDLDPLVQMRSWHVDLDLDGFGDQYDAVEQCDPVDGRQELGQDCDDRDALINPDAVEICNDGVDNDCSGDAPECAPGDSTLEEEGIIRLEGDEPGGAFGSAVATANVADGPELEILVGAPGEGCVYAFNYWGVQIGKVCDSPGFGAVVAGVGDVDGDGLDEWAASGPGVSAFMMRGTPNAQAVDVGVGIPLGDPGYNTAFLSLEAYPSSEFAFVGVRSSKVYGVVLTNAFVYQGEHVFHAWTGRADEAAKSAGAAAVGDFSGDGYPDVVSGAGADDEASAVYMFSLAPDDISEPEEFDGYLRGPDSVVGAIDVLDFNGDGYEDVVVGLPGADEGRVVLVPGPNPSGEMEFSDVQIHGNSTYGVGAVLCGVDLDGDGDKALILGAETDGDWATFAVPLPFEGTVDVEDQSLWRVTGEPGAQAGQAAHCLGTSVGTTLPDFAVSGNLQSESAPGFVYLLEGHGL